MKIDQSVLIQPDEQGYTGRECPECEKYFKIKFGTGLSSVSDCRCPYCNHIDPHTRFFTKEQVEYAKSVVLTLVTEDLVAGLKKLKRNTPSLGFVSIAIKVNGAPIAHYSEKELEERVTCPSCTLQYAIYGTFAYCPDCGVHNSYQILDTNLDVVLKTLDLVNSATMDVAARLVENALEDSVSSFDGFGREQCSGLTRPRSFQDIQRARDQLDLDRGVDISASLRPHQWQFVCEQFQKRHLLAHKMGVIDLEYATKTNSPSSMIGRKVPISEVDVRSLVNDLRVIAKSLAAGVPR